MSGFEVRRRMVAETGPGWAVTDDDGEPKPGRWATEDDAREDGLAGVYLLSGVDVVEVLPTDRERMDASLRAAAINQREHPGT